MQGTYFMEKKELSCPFENLIEYLNINKKIYHKCNSFDLFKCLILNKKKREREKNAFGYRRCHKFSSCNKFFILNFVH